MDIEEYSPLAVSTNIVALDDSFGESYLFQENVLFDE